MNELVIVLRVIHILGSIFWVGTILFNTFFLGPALTSVGPAAGSVMAGLQQRGLLTALPVAALATIGSGLWLYWIDSGGALAAFGRTPVGIAFAVGGMLGIVGFIIAFAVTRPTFAALAQQSQMLASATGTDREALLQRVGELRTRGARSSALVTWILIAAVVAMAVARYM